MVASKNCESKNDLDDPNDRANGECGNNIRDENDVACEGDERDDGSDSGDVSNENEEFVNDKEVRVKENEDDNDK